MGLTRIPGFYRAFIHDYFTLTIKVFSMAAVGLLATALPATLPWNPTAMASEAIPVIDPAPDAPWHITADELTQDRSSGKVVAVGNVVIQKKRTRLTADRVVFDQQRMKVQAEGSVLLTAGEDVLTGEWMSLDLRAETGEIQNGSLFMSDNHFRISGDRILKTGKQQYRIEGAALTSCDGDAPAWRITSRTLDITIEGYGYATHTAFWVKSVPLMYSPLMAFPVKIRRQSGLLTPEMAYSERKGTEIVQPAYWAINPASDATLYVHHMQKRGEKLGVEYRYTPSLGTTGIIMADGFVDRQVEDGTDEAADQWGYGDDDVARTNADRYWVRMKHDQAWHGFNAQIDLDIVSDQDYLNEFREGYTGFTAANRSFSRSFGRGLDAVDDAERLNRLNISRFGKHYSLNAETRWYDNVVSRRQGLTDDTLQTLPSVALSVSRNRVMDSAFYYSADTEYTHFFRQTGERGHRVDLHPRLFMPWRYRNIFRIEPSIGVRETLWEMDTVDTGQKDINRFTSRHLYDVQLNAVSELVRTFAMQNRLGDRLQHSIRPELQYEYVPRVDQGDLPRFDDLDRIEGRDRLTYSVTNVFTTRSTSGTTNNGIRYDYSQLARLKIQQAYSLYRESYHLPEPFSPVAAILELTPRQTLTLRAEGGWSVYGDGMTSRNIGVGLHNRGGDRLFVESRYERENNESIYAELNKSVTDHIDVYTRYERNLKQDHDILGMFGVRYKRQCWAVDLQYADEADDRRYGVLFNLYGLGEIGADISGSRLEHPLDTD